ncbi:type I restriction endonuclease subunit R [Anaeromyxobacter dehalogenans]|uniref:Type I restriction enzyme endonuclease subunit n=1 Tax=Anaeromyxobacter dehalogenans (strain 2CP-C) TaxID=290397 RepID=Q2IKB7_ANADE|nr:type I restriction endonuclease subunit R [Anaeromyxobacter dehalogenans]ABC82097.1 type I site-specific deoxyribonuclease, HsdR family [Anaeromyxobacter dehalogenans 2CP-C]
MTANAYSELALVEAAAMDVLAALQWSAASGADEVFGSSGTLGRESDRDVALVRRLRHALAKLNPGTPPSGVDTAIDELLRDRTAMDPAGANREVHRLLSEGVKVTVRDPRTGQNELRTVRVVDWDHPTENDFLAVEQFAVRGALYKCIPDIVLFVNGLPLVVIELKKPGVPTRQAFDENLTSYKHAQNGVPQLFAFNALLIASNGTEAKVGSLTADWGRFFDWKRVDREDEPRRISMEVLLRGTCEKGRLLDLVRNFSLFSEHKTGLTKILAQNHQFLGVNNAIAATLKARQEGHGRGGVFWQTQGSGKSFSMVFYAQKILRTVPGNWTFVVVTDRVELDDQIAKTFAACGAVEDAAACHATTGENLRDLLRGNHRYVFTLIHKFQTMEVLNDRREIIVIVDEAHRTQYDQLAMNMRAALPNAMFVAFTGTPLIATEEKTREVFGDYVSIYDFQQSIEDGATVRLFYENRTPELRLANPDLNDELYDVIDAAALDAENEARLQKLLGQKYHLITRDDRLDTVAKDIVQHFLARGFQGKAMVVSIDKATAIRTHDKVRREWDAERERVKAALRDYEKAPEEQARLSDRLKRLDTVDMAVIVSPGQNEIEEMQKLGLDIVPHRTRMVQSQPSLDEKFKDPEDPLALVFVCAMWLTGFDAPSCSTVYLDKPMRNHTLMQTIARANRVYPGKHSGVIVDYANVFQSLEKALAIYGAGTGGRTPVRDKEDLVDELRSALAALDAFCKSARVSLSGIEESHNAIERLTRVGEAVNALLSPDDRRKGFQAQGRLVSALYSAVKPHRRAVEFAVRMATVEALVDKIRAELSPEKVDLADVLQRVGEVLDRSIRGAEIAEGGPPPIDLSRIDFQVLAERFRQSKTRNLDLERLKAAIAAQLERLIDENETRVDLRERFESLIEEYNIGSKQIEQLFQELLDLSQKLSEEEKRHIREQLSEEELVVFDLLTRPGPELSPPERDEVKKVARQLLGTVRGILTIDWQKTAQSRARVRVAIEDALDTGLPASYTKDLFMEKAGAIFRHVYRHYGEAFAA